MESLESDAVGLDAAFDEGVRPFLPAEDLACLGVALLGGMVKLGTKQVDKKGKVGTVKQSKQSHLTLWFRKLYLLTVGWDTNHKTLKYRLHRKIVQFFHNK